MNLVLLPHHNTLTSIQKLQALMRSPDISGFQADSLFLPSYPLVCMLAHTDDTPDNQERRQSGGFTSIPSEKTFKKLMAALKDILKETDGSCRFLDMQLVEVNGGCLSESSGRNGESIWKTESQLILPVEVPFLHALQTAGFLPVEAPHFVLGTWFGKSSSAGTSSINQTSAVHASLPAPARVFRLALMQEQPLSSSDGADNLLSEKGGTYSTRFSTANQAAGFSWKFTSAFWVKVR